MELKDKQEIGSRISELIFRLEKNQSTFAEAIGTSQTNVRNVIKSIVSPKYEFLELILKAYPTINKDWLMEGKGEMFLTDEVQTKTEPPAPNGYLMDMLARIESSFKSNIEEKDRVIADQRFIIDTLKNQVAALSSVNAGFIDPNTGEPKMAIVENYIEDLIRA